MPGTPKKTGKADDKDGQQHFDRGFNLGFGKGAEKAERDAKATAVVMAFSGGLPEPHQKEAATPADPQS